MKAAWNALVSEMERPEVAYTHQWAVAAQEAFARTMDPLFVLVHEGHVLRGVVALSIEERQHRASFLARSTADYCDIVSAPEDRAPVFDAIVTHLAHRGIRMLDLVNVPQSSETLTSLPRRTHGYRRSVRPQSQAPFVALGSPEERSRAKHLLRSKRNLRRELRALGEEEGHLTVQEPTTWPEIEPALESLIRTQIARFYATGRVSPLAGSDRRTFVRELAERLARESWLRLAVLRVGEDIATWSLGFQFERKRLWYLASFAPKYGRHSPGELLYGLLLESASSDTGIDAVDLGIGTEPYKARFASSATSTVRVMWTRSLLGWSMVELRNRIVGALERTNPVLAEELRGLKGYLQRLRLLRPATPRRHGLARSEGSVALRWSGAPERAPDGQRAHGTVARASWDDLADLVMSASEDSLAELIARHLLAMCDGREEALLAEGHDHPPFVVWVKHAPDSPAVAGSDNDGSDTPTTVQLIDWWHASGVRSDPPLQAVSEVCEYLFREGDRAWLKVDKGSRAASLLPDYGFQAAAST